MPNYLFFGPFYDLSRPLTNVPLINKSIMRFTYCLIVSENVNRLTDIMPWHSSPKLSGQASSSQCIIRLKASYLCLWNQFFQSKKGKGFILMKINHFNRIVKVSPVICYKIIKKGPSNWEYICVEIQGIYVYYLSTVKWDRFAPIWFCTPSVWPISWYTIGYFAEIEI